MKKRRRDDDVFDERGVLRDGKTFRVKTTLMDAAVKVTDGQGGVAGLNRPGFRLNWSLSRDTVHRAYADYERRLTSDYRDADGDEEERLCPKCVSSGFDKNGEDDCPACDDTAALDAESESKAEEARGGDSRSVNQIMRDHQANMDRIYADHDRKLSEAWRRS